MARIQVDDVWKQFLLKKDRADSVGNLLVQMIPGRGRVASEPFWALQGISIDMQPGTSFGIVGNNGSGKSTLLKLLTRTMKPTKGAIRVQGRVSALIELGAGFHPDFSGRENVFLNASILGIPRRTIAKELDAIIDFAEIRPFIDTPVKYYSSGMMARLGFAVATNVHPDILIVDEVLAVGDEAFQQKCMDRIFRMKRDGISILLVSHDLGSIERLMDQAVWIDRGVMKAQGAPRNVIYAYRQALAGKPATEAEGQHIATENSLSVAPLQLVEAFLSDNGRPVDHVVSGSTMSLVTQWDNDGAPMTAHLGFTIRRPDGLEIGNISSLREGRPLLFRNGKQTVVVETKELRLTTGEYEIDAVLQEESGRRLREWKPLMKFRVQAMDRAPGLLVLPHEWRVD